MSKVLVNNLIVRAAQSIASEEIAQYNAGDIINSGEELIENEERIWLRYAGQSGNKRYVMVYDKDNTPYVDVAPIIPGPRPIKLVCAPPPNPTGIPGIPIQSQFPDHRNQNWSYFLCICVKGGLTTFDQCMNCFHWGISSGKLRASDCYVKCDKEQWAREIAMRYCTILHLDYIFQKNNHHYWLTQGEKEVFNSNGIGWR